MPIVISSPLQRWGKTARTPYDDLFPNAMGDMAGTCIRFPIKGGKPNHAWLTTSRSGHGTLFRLPNRNPPMDMLLRCKGADLIIGRCLEAITAPVK